MAPVTACAATAWKDAMVGAKCVCTRRAHVLRDKWCIACLSAALMDCLLAVLLIKNAIAGYTRCSTTSQATGTVVIPASDEALLLVRGQPET